MRLLVAGALWVLSKASSLFMHGGLFLVIAGLMTAITVLFVAFIANSGFLTTLALNPFLPERAGAAATSMLEALWLVDQFVDVVTLIFIGVTCAVYNLVLAVHGLIVQIAFRALPGCIVFAFLQVNSFGAADVELFNRSGQMIYVTGAGVSGEAVLEIGGALELPAYVGATLGIGTNTGVESVAWTNAHTVEDARVSLLVGSDGAGGFTVSEAATETVWQAFRRGAGVAGGVLLFQLVVWMFRIVTANQSGEGRLE